MNDIKPGDRVMVAYPTKCCGKGKLGAVYTVERLYIDQDPVSFCGWCRRSGQYVGVAMADLGRWKLPLYRLIKLPPLTESETREAMDDLKLPEQPVTQEN